MGSPQPAVGCAETKVSQDERRPEIKIQKIRESQGSEEREPVLPLLKTQQANQLAERAHPSATGQASADEANTEKGSRSQTNAFGV